jgi:hypothetical protein
MSRGLLCNVLDRDLACAGALGFVDLPRVSTNPQTVTIHDANMRLVGSVPDWLSGADPLDVATREYLQARQEATLSGTKPNAKPWEAAARAKARDEATKRALQAKARGKILLDQRGVLDRARAEQLRVIE